ncbi:MAG: hypothetical protein IJ316_00615 [Clostridia bacterium]|nr:hypothetical protein [Clostridia bacterium]
MVDLHSHALFGIDDGAQTIEDSIAILKRARSFGINKMVLTPHFSIGDDVEEFLYLRNKHFDMLEEEAEELGIELKAGAEVYITDELFNETELEKLVIGDGNVILCEFKYHALSPETFIEYIDYVLAEGLRVLVAHPERYSYLRCNRMLLEALLDRGVMLQVNAISLFEDNEEGDFARMLVRNNFAYCIGSDIHHASSRRLNAMGEVMNREKLDDLINGNPDRIFGNN